MNKYRQSTGVACTAALLAALLILPGCQNDSPSSETSGSSEEQGSAAIGSGYDCADRLDAALQMVRPDRLGISSESETAESRFNLWLEMCGDKIDVSEPPGEEFQQLLEPVLSPTEMSRLTANRFVERDAEHVRNGQLYKAIATLPLDRPDSDLARAVELFHFCMRNVALHTADDERLPLTPYEILLFGRGTASDIAWVYANVLRQLQIDSVIIHPAAARNQDGEQNDPADRWLLGVLLDDQVYLFDPRLGTPLPAAADSGQSPTVEQPATLAEVQQNDGLLRRLDFSDERPYPFTAESLKKVTVDVIGTRSLWTTSMARLQSSLSGERAMVVYDGLQDFGDAPGLIARLAEQGGDSWSRSDVGIWPYPSAQLDARGQLDETGRQRLTELELPLDAPIPVTVDQVAQRVTFGAPQKRHLRTRTTYLMGDHEAAVRGYQGLRIQILTAARIQLPSEIAVKHNRAADDAAYWIGLCQFELGNFEPTVSTFRDYLTRYEDQPDAAWTAHCRMMLALTLAETGDWSEALFELRDEAKTPEPLQERRQFWIRRWTAAEKTADT